VSSLLYKYRCINLYSICFFASLVTSLAVLVTNVVVIAAKKHTFRIHKMKYTKITL